MDDFNDTSVRVTVNAGETTATVSIMIIDDDLLELTELFDVEFSIEDTPGAEIREPGIAEIAILNDDGMLLFYTMYAYILNCMYFKLQILLQCSLRDNIMQVKEPE